MIVNKVICLASALIATLAGCSGPLGERELPIVGTYHTYMTENIKDGSMRCVARALVEEDMRPNGLGLLMHIDLTFHFCGALEFQDVRVSYETRADGDWGMAGDTLRISPDTTTLRSKFVGSNASNNVEEAMVRQLRHNIIAEVMPKLCKQYASRSNVAMVVMANSDLGIVGALPDSSVVILQKAK